jgi:hypothetical protein
MQVFIVLSPQPIQYDGRPSAIESDMVGVLPIYFTEAAAKAAHPNHRIVVGEVSDTWHPQFSVTEPQAETPNTEESAEI